MLALLTISIMMAWVSAERDPGTRVSSTSLHPREKKQLKQDPLAVLAASIPGGGAPGIDYPILSSVPYTRFSCRDYVGYFADASPETRCQVYHVCQADSRQNAFLCPNGTIFNQRILVCDWWFNVDCKPISGINIAGKTEKKSKDIVNAYYEETDPKSSVVLSANIFPTTPVVQSSIQPYEVKDESDEYESEEDSKRDKALFTIYHNPDSSESHETKEKKQFESQRSAIAYNNVPIVSSNRQVPETSTEISHKHFHDGDIIHIARTYEVPIHEHPVTKYTTALQASSNNNKEDDISHKHLHDGDIIHIARTYEVPIHEHPITKYTTALQASSNNNKDDSALLMDQKVSQVYDIPSTVTETYKNSEEYSKTSFVNSAYSTPRKTTIVPVVSAITSVQNTYKEPQEDYSVPAVDRSYAVPLDISVADVNNLNVKTIYVGPTLTSELYETPRKETSIVKTVLGKSPLDHLLMHSIIQEAESTDVAFDQRTRYETPEIPTRQSSHQVSETYIAQGSLSKPVLDNSSQSSEEDVSPKKDGQEYSKYDQIQDSSEEESYSPSEEDSFPKEEYSLPQLDPSQENPSLQQKYYPTILKELSPPRNEHSPPQIYHSPIQNEYNHPLEHDHSSKEHSAHIDSSSLPLKSPVTRPNHSIAPSNTKSVSKSVLYGPLFRHVVLANSFPLARYAAPFQNYA